MKTKTPIKQLSDAAVLVAIFELAIKNGFDTAVFGYTKDWWESKSEAEKIVFFEDLLKKDYTSYKSIIYNHDFAKSVFGEKEIFEAIYPNGEYDDNSSHWIPEDEWEELKKQDDRYTDDLVDREMPIWKYALGEMVREKDDIDYLRLYLREGFI